MKQIVQNLRSGALEVIDVPCPPVSAGHLLIQTRSTLISAGTERMLVEFGKSNLLAKARSQPDKVKQVLDKVKTDGLLPTLETVFARLDEPLPLGYCNAGVVLEVGEGVRDFQPGDRVAGNGPHAEIVCVPRNLCARIPDGVDDDSAAFTVLSSIALQGIRLTVPALGESIAVVGLGLIGLVAVQLLRYSGCRVLGIDPDPKRRELAETMGAESAFDPTSGDPVQAGIAFSRGAGMDGVLITASAKTNDIIKQAAQMSRKRGRIVLIGVVGLELNRADFYEKELTFQVSCSYGPGRYDPEYELRGHDYPLGFVRWTEQRNFQAVLDMMSDGRLNVRQMISKVVPQCEAQSAYQALSADREALGIILTYPRGEPPRKRGIELSKPARTAAVSAAAGTPAKVGIICAGNFAKLVLIPAIKAAGAKLACIAARGGVSAAHAARKFGFESVSSDTRSILSNPDINTVFIITRHDTHARFIIESLEAGKHVFVEKPLALTAEELRAIEAAHRRRPDRQLMVGFNRRFAPHVNKIRSLMSTRLQPAALIMTVNAGAIPVDHWTQDPKIGGGRIIGEGCHWIDLLLSLVGHPIVAVQSTPMSEPPDRPPLLDTMTITLTFADGSIGTIHYFANGSKSFAKERLDVFFDGKVLSLDNFKVLRGYGVSKFSTMKLWRQDKGHRAEVAEFIGRIAGGGDPVIPFAQLRHVTWASFAAVHSARTGEVARMSEFAPDAGERHEGPVIAPMTALEDTPTSAALK